MISIVLDGSELPVARSIVRKQGIVMAPLIGVVDHFVDRASVRSSNGSIIISRARHELILRCNSRQGFLNAGPVTLPTPPDCSGETPYLPLAYVARSFGAYVHFMTATQVLIINMPHSLSVRRSTLLDSLPPDLPAHVVFTPSPVPIPAATFTPASEPRRTPIPVRPGLPPL